MSWAVAGGPGPREAAAWHALSGPGCCRSAWCRSRCGYMRRPSRTSFHQFEKGTADRLRYQRVSERTGHEVEYSDVVKGAGIGGGDYVLLSQDELDEIAPGRSRLLDIHQFADAGGAGPPPLPQARLPRPCGPRR